MVTAWYRPRLHQRFIVLLARHEQMPSSWPEEKMRSWMRWAGLFGARPAFVRSFRRGGAAWRGPPRVRASGPAERRVLADADERAEPGPRRRVRRRGRRQAMAPRRLRRVLGAAGRRTVARAARAGHPRVRNAGPGARGRSAGPREGRAREGAILPRAVAIAGVAAGRRRRAGLGGALARPRLRAAGRSCTRTFWNVAIVERAGLRRASFARVLADEPPRADRDRARPGGIELPAAASVR